MFAYIPFFLQEFVLRQYGPEKFNELKGNFNLNEISSANQFLSDVNLEKTIRIIGDGLSIKREKLLRICGQFYVSLLIKFGYALFLKLLGKNMMEFCQNIDSIHFYSASCFGKQKLNTPSFHVDLSKSSEDNFFLHYFSHYENLHFMINGILEEVARRFHNKGVEMTLHSQTKEECESESNKNIQEHVIWQVKIVPLKKAMAPPTFVAQTCRNYEQQLKLDDVRKVKEKIAQMKEWKAKKGGVYRAKWKAVARLAVMNKKALRYQYPVERFISSELACTIFPYHMVIGVEKFNCLQAGNIMQNVIPDLRLKGRNIDLEEYFNVHYPPNLKFTSGNLLKFHQSTFIISIKNYMHPLLLRCHIIQLKPDFDAIMLLISPIVRSLADLFITNLTFHDLPIHDVTRDFILMNLSNAMGNESAMESVGEVNGCPFSYGMKNAWKSANFTGREKDQRVLKYADANSLNFGNDIFAELSPVQLAQIGNRSPLKQFIDCNKSGEILGMNLSPPNFLCGSNMPKDMINNIFDESVRKKKELENQNNEGIQTLLTSQALDSLIIDAQRPRTPKRSATSIIDFKNSSIKGEMFLSSQDYDKLRRGVEYDGNFGNRMQSTDVEKHYDLLVSSFLPGHLWKQFQKDAHFFDKFSNTQHDNVAVLFSDIVGFSKLVEENSPLKISKLLNQIYTEYDRMCLIHNVFRVETIGDACSIVAGLGYSGSETTCDRLANMALGMLVVAKGINLFNKIQIRIGIHYGKVGASIVKYRGIARLLIIGKTCTVAARLESHGLPNRIQISEDFQKQLHKRDHFVIKPRNKIEVRGLGQMTTFWLMGNNKVTDEHLLNGKSNEKPIEY